VKSVALFLPHGYLVNCS